MPKPEFLLLIACFLSCRSLFCQTTDETNVVEKLIEEIAEIYEEETDFSTLTEALQNYYDYPLNINSCTYEQLAQLQFLTDYQIKSLLEYIKTKGPIVSVNEIQFIYGYDMQLARYLEPFIFFGEKQDINKPALRNHFKYPRHELFFQTKTILEESKGYLPVPDTVLSQDPEKSRYLGNSLKYRVKYLCSNTDRFYFGFQGEKDAGEEFFESSNRGGFDFYSGFLQIKNTGVVKNLIIGDYQLQFGQGLTLWNGMAMSKSSFTGISRIPAGIKRYNSTDEYSFFRGVAATFKLKDIELTPFFSLRNIDANMNDNAENGKLYFSSFKISGLHRTPLEIQDEKEVQEIAYGTNIALKKENFHLGATFSNFRYNARYEPKQQLYNVSGFRGYSLVCYGVDFRYRYKNALFFGEFSNGNEEYAYLGGAEINLHPHVSMSILHRNYSNGFYTRYNNPFSEYSAKNNEKGTYTGITITSVKFLKLTAYVDIFKSPWLRYQVNSPSFGKDYFIQLDFTPNNKFSTALRFKNESNSKNIATDSITIPYIVNFTITGTRLQAEYKLIPSLKLKARFEWTIYKEEGKTSSEGYLIYQDINYVPEKLPFSIYLRISRFQTGSFDSRIYTYENSMLYNYSVPFYYNNGMRGYIMMKFKPFRIATLWIKYGFSRYYNIDSIGSGLDEISGKSKSEAEFMIRMNF